MLICNSAKKRFLCIWMVAIVLFMVAGCASQGGLQPHARNQTVNLSKNNFKLIKAGAKGESSGFNLLGFIPFLSPNYADAQAALYRSSGESLTGKSIALANEAEDRSNLYLILFSIPKITLTADIIEFIDDQNN